MTVGTAIGLGEDDVNALITAQIASLASPADLPVAQTRRTTGDVNVSSTFAALVYDTLDYQNNTDVLQHNSANKSQITPKETGVYLVCFESEFETGTASNTYSVEMRLLQNSVLVPGTTVMADVLSDSSLQGNPIVSTISHTIPVYLTANQPVQVAMRSTFQGGSTSTVKSIGTPTFSLVRLKGSKGAKGDAGLPGAGSNINVLNAGSLIAGGPHGSINFIGAAAIANAGSGVVDVTVNQNKPFSQVALADANGAGGSANMMSATSTPTSSTGRLLGTVVITPTSASAMIVVNIGGTGDVDGDRAMNYALFRGTTLIGVTVLGMVKRGQSGGAFSLTVNDSPATTSPVTYTLRAGTMDGTDWWNNSTKDLQNWGNAAGAKGKMSARQI